MYCHRNEWYHHNVNIVIPVNIDIDIDITIDIDIEIANITTLSSSPYHKYI